MFGLGKSRNKPLYAALFDIGSESVGIAIVESDKSQQYPKVLFSHRVHMRITKKKLTMGDRLRTMKEALFSASLIISRDGIEALALHNKHARIGKVMITCSAPWSYTISRNVAYENETELKVSRELVDDLVTSAESEIEKHLNEATTGSELTYDIVERATVDVRINDYPILKPFGLRGKEISLVHVTGLIPREVITVLKEVEEKIFPNTELRAHTFLLVLYCVLRELYTDKTALTIVHVTGDSTEFGIIEGDTLVESLSVPTGLESIVRSLMVNEGETAKEMYALLEMYSKNELADDARARVENALKTYIQEVSESIKEQAAARRFPKTAFVLAPSPFTDLFVTVLDKTLHDTLGITGELLTLAPDVLNATALDESDTNISIASRFFHKLHGCGEIE